MRVLTLITDHNIRKYDISSLKNTKFKRNRTNVFAKNHLKTKHLNIVNMNKI